MKFVGPVIALVFGFAALPSLFTAYQRLYPSPVISDMAASHWVLTSEYVEAQITGRKLRNCVPVKGSFAGYALQGNTWHETDFIFIEDKSPDSSRPEGINDFGVWRWDVSEAEEVMVTVTHICNGIAVPTTIGPFELEE